MDNLRNIKKLVDDNKLDYSHFTLAQFINETVEGATEFCLWLCVLVNVELSRGNVCIVTSSIKTKSQEIGWTNLPALKEIIQKINLSPVIGSAEQLRPLIAENNKIYLNRYFHNEKNIADSLLAMSQNYSTDISLDRVHKLFGHKTDVDSVDYQKLAAIISCRHQLSVISGGPGTGKTWTVSKILALLVQQSKTSDKLKIKLAAPTGKAAARLSESIQKLKHEMQLNETIKSQIPVEAVTLHRLLGIHRFTHRPHYNKKNPLSCDVLVLDEASMIDQQMMAAICMAIPATCKLILLGDKDQLSSVEAGSVFADLCGNLKRTEFDAQQLSWIKQSINYDLPLHRSNYALTDHVVVLQKSHRFDAHSGIGLLAHAINQGDAKNCIKQLQKDDLFSIVRWNRHDERELSYQLQQQAEKTYLKIVQADSVEQAFSLFHQYQILSAVWAGPTGVDTINSLIEDYVKTKSGQDTNAEFYKGKPIMMTSNVYQYDIHNGDIGIIWPDEEGQLKVVFELSTGNYRFLSLSQCPAHKPAYAMTVHKSQGSEFNHILLILPNQESAVCTRELFYTGITRAAESVEIWGSESVISSTIQQKTVRVSGLMERLMVKN